MDRARYAHLKYEKHPWVVRLRQQFVGNSYRVWTPDTRPWHHGCYVRVKRVNYRGYFLGSGSAAVLDCRILTPYRNMRQRADQPLISFQETDLMDPAEWDLLAATKGI